MHQFLMACLTFTIKMTPLLKHPAAVIHVYTTNGHGPYMADYFLSANSKVLDEITITLH